MNAGEFTRRRAAGRLEGEIILGHVRRALAARRGGFRFKRKDSPMNQKAGRDRATVSRRRVRELLSRQDRIAVRIRAEQPMEHGRDWLWRGGDMAYTATGLRVLVDYFARENDAEAAGICEGLAGECDREDAAPAPIKPCCERDTDGDGNCDRHPAGGASSHRAIASSGRASEPDTFAQLEKRGLA